jgi:hypothetical protein
MFRLEILVMFIFDGWWDGYLWVVKSRGSFCVCEELLVYDAFWEFERGGGEMEDFVVH